MAKAYVMLVPIGAEDPNGNPIPIKRGRPIFDAEVVVNGTSAKLTAVNPLYTVPSDLKENGAYARYMWIVKAVDAAMKVVSDEVADANATTGKGFRLMAGDVEEFLAEGPNETLALVTI